MKVFYARPATGLISDIADASQYTYNKMNECVSSIVETYSKCTKIKRADNSQQRQIGALLKE